jgi:tetratricopeptide (TPR) repeat protein
LEIKEKEILDNVDFEEAIKLGRRKAREGSIKEALDVCQIVIERSPHNKKARDLLKKVLSKSAGQSTLNQDPAPSKLQVVVELYGQGQLQPALDLIQKLLQDYPDSPVIYNMAGVINAGLRNLDAAISCYEKAILAKPVFVEAHYNQGICFNDGGNLTAAVGSFKRAILINPNYAEAYNNLGNVYKSMKNFDAAVGCYNRVIEIIPHHADAYNNLGNALKDKGELDLALQSYMKAIKIDPERSDSLNNMGNVFREKGDLDQALRLYDRALSINPNYAEAYNNQGNAWKDLNKIDSAIDCYEKALELKPNHAEAYFNLGSTLRSRGDLLAALKVFQASFLINSNDVEIYLQIASALNEMGELDLAVDSYGKALLINPNREDVYNDMGFVFLLNDDYDAAERSFRKALDLNNEYVRAYCNLGLVAMRKDNFEIAIKNYNKVIDLDSVNVDAYLGLASALKQLDQLEIAIETHKKALNISPDSALNYTEIAQLYFRTGELTKALDILKDATKVNSKDPDVFFGDLLETIFWILQALKYTDPALGEKSLTFFIDTLQSKADNLERSLLQFKLARNGESQERFLRESLTNLSQEKKRKIFNPSHKVIVEKKEDPESLVALIHFGRSGTGFLHSLIDGHPDIATLPSIYLSEFFNRKTWAQITRNGWSEMIGNFMSIYDVLFDARSNKAVTSISGQKLLKMGEKEGMTSLGVNRDEAALVDRNRFRERLSALMEEYKELDQLSFFRLVQKAHDYAIDDLNKKDVIFYHIHNPDFYTRLNLVKFAPKAKWITMVREPIQACESWVRTGFEKGKYSVVVSSITTMLLQLQDGSYSKQNTVGVKLEDVKRYPRKTIPALCDWMGVPDHESLYEMTAQGKRWWGDSHSPDYERDGMDPFGTTSIDRKPGMVFSDNDQFILRTLFYPFSVKFGYIKENRNQFRNDLKAIRPLLNQIFDFEKKIAINAQAIRNTLNKIRTVVSTSLSLGEDKDHQEFMNFVDNFEPEIERSPIVDLEKFKKSGDYFFLRSVLVESWEILNEHGTYPNLIERLLIEEA